MPERAIRIVAPRYGANVLGGTETLLRRLARSLAQAGWRVEVLTTRALDEMTWANELPPGREDDGGVAVRRFPVRRPRRPKLFHALNRVLFPLPRPVRPESLWIALQGPFTPELVAALAAEPPMPTLFSPYLYYPSLVGLPLARGARLLNPAAHDEPPLRLRVVTTMLKASDALLYGTPEEQALLEERQPIAQRIPSAVGTTAVEPPPDVDRERFAARRGIAGPYLYCGGRAKKLGAAMDGLALLRRDHPDATLVLSGGTPAGLRDDGVRHVGTLSDTDRWDAIAGACAVITPSSRESLSLLALEAWSVGRPIIFNAGSEVLAGQSRRSGGGFPFHDATEFAAAAARLIDKPALADDAGESARRFVLGNYTWPSVHERLAGLIDTAERARR